MTTRRPTAIADNPVLRTTFRTIALGVGVPVMALVRAAGVEAPVWRALTRPMAKRFTAPAFGEYEPDARDVIVSTFSKSGTNWMLQIAYQIAWRGAGTFDHVHDVIPWPDSPPNLHTDLRDRAAADAAPTGMRVIKTHLPREHVPYRPQARYVTMIRDPKDVFVSSWHFFRGIALGPLMPTPQAWLDLFCSPDCPIGSWAEHVAGWWALRYRDNVLVLTFAELRADLAADVDRVAALMGIALDETERAAVIERASFETMRAMDERFHPGLITPLAREDSRMMRRGKRGAGTELLDADQRRRVDDWFRAELARLGSDFPYDELFVVDDAATTR